MEPARPSVRPAVLLMVVVVMAIAGRAQISWLERTTSYHGFAPQSTAEWTFLVGTFAVALASSLFAAVVAKPRVNCILAVLLAAAVGGLFTASYNAVPGIALGGTMGIVVASAIVRRIVMAVLKFIAALLGGAACGTAVLAFTGNPGDGWHGPMAWSMLALACVAGSLLFWSAWRARTRQRWLRFAGHAVLLLAVVAGQWLSLSVDTLRRFWWLGTGGHLCLVPRGESWLYRGVIGVQAFVGGRRVTDRQLETIGGWQELWNLQLGGASVTDAGLVHIRRLSRVSYLGLNQTPITDDGVGVLASMKGLMQVDLRGTQVTDRALAHLQRLPSLVDLHLDHTEITDDGLQHLQSLWQLQLLGLAGTRVGGEGLRHLAALPRLYDLNLADTQVTDDDFALFTQPRLGYILDLSGTRITDRIVERFSGAVWLKLARTGITDEGLRGLPDFSFLTRLDLTDTQVTDAGVAHLKKLCHLTHLQLAGTGVTCSGLIELKELPNLHHLDVHQTSVRSDDLLLLRGKLTDVTIVADEEESSVKGLP